MSITRIRIQGAEVVGGPPSIEVEQGQRVRIIVAADAPDEIHLHGYDIERDGRPGRPGGLQLHGECRGRLRAREPHRRGRGTEPLVARLVVNPS